LKSSIVPGFNLRTVSAQSIGSPLLGDSLRPLTTADWRGAGRS
jgi:hypothetical protein